MDRRAAVVLLGTGAVMSAVMGCKGPSGLKWAESSAPRVRVNQVGYLPGGPKSATLVLESPQPVPFELRDEGGRVLFSGTSQPRGLDRASGDRVHLLDFSAHRATGTKLRLRAGDAESFPFDVRPDLYAQLKLDALKYFYHNRSGIDVVRPFVDDDLWARQAGHLSDRAVPCWGRSCDYVLDVSGGWYDAGDYGKYVVNGGISAWTLQALFERSVHVGPGQAPFGDGPLRIPESGNGIPDLLDEARWEVEFLLKMQVPAGQPFAGMAHHKIHDHEWSGLGIEPAPHATNRGLHPPSTAATLNLAAVAAQAARIWKELDPGFSQRCLDAALRAWAAARRHPDKLAPRSDDKGGGAYSDERVEDEFFWAAAELYVTRQDPALLEYLLAHPDGKRFPTRLGEDGDGLTSSMTWQSTAALGWISLAVVPSALPEEVRQRLRDGIVAAGDFYLEVMQQEGYRVPLGLGESGKYPWGSNSFLLNNALVMSLAYDFTKDAKYAAGVAEAMDYLLGRNPLVQSYVSGYGSVPLRHPHHRFWAEGYRSGFPPPPPGAVSGGPNSSLQDPQSRRSGLTRDLPPQKCFVDHIEAWSVNEVAINWNAPLTWVTAFLDEWRGG